MTDSKRRRLDVAMTREAVLVRLLKERLHSQCWLLRANRAAHRRRQRNPTIGPQPRDEV